MTVRYQHTAVTLKAIHTYSNRMDSRTLARRGSKKNVMSFLMRLYLSKAKHGTIVIQCIHSFWVSSTTKIITAASMLVRVMADVYAYARAYERQCHMRFDWFLRVRPDAIMTQPITLQQVTRHVGITLVRNWLTGKGDFFFILDRISADVFISALEEEQLCGTPCEALQSRKGDIGKVDWLNGFVAVLSMYGCMMWPYVQSYVILKALRSNTSLRWWRDGWAFRWAPLPGRGLLCAVERRCIASKITSSRVVWSGHSNTI